MKFGRFNVLEKLAGLGLVRRSDAATRKAQLLSSIGDVQAFYYIYNSPHYQSSVERLLSEIEKEAQTKLSNESDIHTKALHFQTLEVVKLFRTKMAEEIQAHNRFTKEYDDVELELKEEERQ